MQETIPTQIRNVIAQHQKSLPVDVKALAEDLGLKTWESRTIGDGISGKLVPDHVNGGMAGFSIIVNANEPYNRKRFTVAHEIAHFILHREQLLHGDGIVDNTLYRSGLSNQQERQANVLAADILMPLSLIEKMTRKGVTSVSDLAAKFGVSPLAMKLRLDVPLV